MAINDPTLAPQDPMGVAPMMAPPDPYADREKILALVKEKHATWSKGGREGIVRNAWRNILFKRGHQWLVYDRGRAWWRPVDVKKYSGPRPVTNRFASTMNAFTSVLARIEPTLNFRPATEDPEDKATAEVADRVIEVCESEVNLRLQRQLLAQWVGYTGGAWLESGYDPSPEHGMVTIQEEDPMTGQLVDKEVPRGKMYTEVMTIFEAYFDAGIEDWTKVREYIRKKSLDEATAKKRWGEAAEGVSSDLGSASGDTYQDQLPLLAGFQPETGPGAGLLQNRGGQMGRISEMHYRGMPTEEYPGGLYAVVLGGQKLVHVGPLPYHDDNGPFLNSVYFPIDPVPGSLYSKTPADDLALKQVQRNTLEAHIMMTMNRMAWPIWVVPEGANVSQFTGEAGQIIKYNALGPNPSKPERMQGAGLPNGAITWLQYIDQDFEELTAAYAGTKGDRATGVSAGIALQMIQERAQQRFGPMYVLWEQAWSEWARQQLAIFRQFATEPRLLQIQGRDSQWRIEKFMGSDLSGRVNIVAEAGSAAPRSTLVDRAELEQLSANGAIPPASMDPEIMEKWLEAFGRTDWIPGMKADSETAARQIETFEQLALDPNLMQIIGYVIGQAQQWSQQMAMQGMPPVTYSQVIGKIREMGGPSLPRIRPTVDGHMTLAREFATWLKGMGSQSLPEPIQLLVEMKHAEHMMYVQQQQMMQAQARGGTYPTSGFLSNPGGQQNATNSSGPGRMDGEQREMEQQAA